MGYHGNYGNYVSDILCMLILRWSFTGRMSSREWGSKGCSTAASTDKSQYRSSLEEEEEEEEEEADIRRSTPDILPPTTVFSK